MSKSFEIISLSSDESSDGESSSENEEFDIRVEQGWTEESISDSEEDESVVWYTENEINDSIMSDDSSQDDELNENSDIDLDQWIRRLSNGGNHVFKSLFDTIQFNGQHHWSGNSFIIKYNRNIYINQKTTHGKANVDSLNKIFEYIDTDSEFLINRITIMSNCENKPIKEFIVNYDWNLTKLEKFLTEDVHVNDLKRCITGSTLKLAKESEISTKSVISLRDIRDFFIDSLVEDPIRKQNIKDHYKLQRKNKFRRLKKYIEKFIEKKIGVPGLEEFDSLFNNDDFSQYEQELLPIVRNGRYKQDISDFYVMASRTLRILIETVKRDEKCIKEAEESLEAGEGFEDELENLKSIYSTSKDRLRILNRLVTKAQNYLNNKMKEMFNESRNKEGIFPLDNQEEVKELVFNEKKKMFQKDLVDENYILHTYQNDEKIKRLNKELVKAKEIEKQDSINVLRKAIKNRMTKIRQMIKGKRHCKNAPSKVEKRTMNSIIFNMTYKGEDLDEERLYSMWMQ